MKLFTLKQRRSDPTTTVVYLEIGVTFRAVAERVIWHVMWMLLGAALYRVYLFLTGY